MNIKDIKIGSELYYLHIMPNNYDIQYQKVMIIDKYDNEVTIDYINDHKLTTRRFNIKTKYICDSIISLLSKLDEIIEKRKKELEDSHKYIKDQIKDVYKKEYTQELRELKLNRIIG